MPFIDMDLAIDDGEFVALLGPSGCGKTSTLRMIVGLESISGGVIRLRRHKPSTTLTPEQRNVAMAFETYALYPNFTIAENLGLPARGEAASTKADACRRGQSAVARPAAHRGRSSSQKPRPAVRRPAAARVSLGRALIRDPAVFILDEVMSHLDAHLKLQMLFELKRIHQSARQAPWSTSPTTRWRRWRSLTGSPS